MSWLPWCFLWTHCLDSLNARFSITASLCFVWRCSYANGHLLGWRCYYANGHLLGWTCRTGKISCFGVIGCFSSTGLICRDECTRAKSHTLMHLCSNHVKKRIKTGVCCMSSIPAVLMCYWMVWQCLSIAVFSQFCAWLLYVYKWKPQHCRALEKAYQQWRKQLVLAIFLVAQLSLKRGVLVHKNLLASCQRCRHSVEPRALTCLFKHSDLIAWSLLSWHPTHKYIRGRLCFDIVGGAHRDITILLQRH